MSGTAPAKQSSRPGRDGKTTIAAWVTQDSAFVFQELLLKLGRERKARVTMQEAVIEALTEYARKHGVEATLS